MSLREEHKKYLQDKDDVITEAALTWFERNVVLINEQIDRRTVKRIIDSITKFDSVFGKYKHKLPAIADMISSAEEDLQYILTGKSSEKKATNMLKKMSYLYTTFANFFNSDLPVLLSSHLFSAARENPDVKLNVLQPSEGTKYNPAFVLDALTHALVPNKEEMALMKKIYKKELPLVDAKAIANQLLQLSYNELNELTSIGKVPAMAIPETTPAPGQTPAQPPAAPVVPEATPAPVTTTTPVTKTESVDGLKKKDKKSIILESHVLLLELNQKQMTKVVDIMNQLQSNFNIAGMENVDKSLKNLISKARQEISNNKWFQGSAVKQLVGFYNLMDNLNQQWPQIKQLFSDGKLDAKDQADLQKLLTAATQDNVFGRLAKAFKLQTPHAAGLDPASVVKGIMAAANQQNGVQSVSDLFEKAKSLPQTDPTTGEPKVQGQTTETQKPAPANDNSKPVRADQAKQTGTATGTTPSAGKQEMNVSNIAADVVAKNKLPKEQSSNWEAFLTTLEKSGYQVTKK